MNQAVQFLKECKTFFLATLDGDQPRVRPFGAVTELDRKVYICTNNTKDCFRQMLKNPKAELSASIGGRWIRVCGTVVVDPSLEARTRFLQECPILMYKPDDGIFEVLYFTNATATLCSFGAEPVTVEFGV